MLAEFEITLKLSKVKGMIWNHMLSRKPSRTLIVTQTFVYLHIQQKKTMTNIQHLLFSANFVCSLQLIRSRTAFIFCKK